MCGAAYSLKKVTGVRLGEGGVIANEGEVGRLVRGKKEGEWLREWEYEIVRGVLERRVQAYLEYPRIEPARGLDGYTCTHAR